MTFNWFAALAAYIPRDRIEAVLNPSHKLAEVGVALIADISGFTPLAEALTQGLSEGEGAEELTRALTAVFTPLIAEIHAFRGAIIKFSGDAMIVWFGRTRRGRRAAVIRRALTCAWQMQRRIEIDGQIPTPIGVIRLRMKIGLAYGSVKRFNLGLAEYGYEDVLAGATLDLMAEAEHLAVPGEIILPQATAAHLPQAFTVSQWRGDFAVVGELTQPARRLPWPLVRPTPDSQAALSQALAPYLPRPIYEALLSGQAQVAELKPVVSLFIQFHGLDYDDDPAVGEKLQRYFVTAQRVVARYNGRLNRLITGDKGSLLHIIFGAPRTVEEQEARAVRCALDLQAECGSLPFIRMQRVGMAAGRVFAGPVGSSVRHDYTTLGDSINLSARLMQVAADDQILLETAVREQLGSEFRLTDLGSVRVKGKAEPVYIFSAEGVQTRQTRRRLRQIPPIFGRESEMAKLRQRLADLSEGHGGLMTLVGDVGMGKTLIFDVLRAETEQRWADRPAGAGLWASGISLAYGQLFSGYLFIDLLRDLLTLPPDASPDQTSQYLLRFCQDVFGEARLASTYPYLAKFMGLPLAGEHAQRVEGLGGESLRWQVFELIPEMLRLLSGRHPLILTLDDLQWADPTSLQLVESLLPLLIDAPILIILAMRPEADSEAWALSQHQLAAFIFEESGVKDALQAPISNLTLYLGALDKTAAAQLISHHAPNLPPRVMAYLVEKGGGNPLFLVEMVRTLAAKGLLSGEVDLQSMALDALDLPNSVQGLLLAQLDRLAVEARHTLQMAAVIGKTFLHKVLETIAGAEQQVQNQLVALEQRDYIQPDRADLGAAHTFRHILIQESAYNTLLHERRRDYHRQTAEALEYLFPAAIAEQSAFLAYHYEQAGMLDEAIYFHQQTADQARLLYAHTEAESLYHKILSLLDQQEAVGHAPNLERRAKTTLKLAQTRANALDFMEAQAYYDEAFTLFSEFERAQSQEVDKHISESEKIFKWGILEEFTHNFDPATVEVTYVAEIVNNLFEGLVELDSELNIGPAMAKRWEVDESGIHYRFQLRNDLRWSDGHPLSAHDFIFAWRRNLNPQTKAGMAHLLYVVEGAEEFHTGQNADPDSISIRARDDTTIEITLKAAISYFPYLLAQPITFPQPSHLVQAQGHRWGVPTELVCNGPFKVSQEMNDQEIILKRNHHYRGFSTGNLDQVQLRPVEPTLNNYRLNAVDWCVIGDRADIPHIYAAERYLVQEFRTFALGFSCHSYPFNQRAARQALAHSINRKELVESVWAGVQKPAIGGFVPPGMPGHSPEIGLEFDPIAAREIVQGVDLNSTQIKLAPLPGFSDTPYYLQKIWKQLLGVDVEIEENLPVEDILRGLGEGNLHLVLIAWNVTYPDPDDPLRNFFYGTSPLNYFGWHNDMFDAALDMAATSTDPNERLALYHQADKLLVTEDVGIVPLYYLQATGLLRRGYSFGDSSKIVRGGFIQFKNIWAS